MKKNVLFIVAATIAAIAGIVPGVNAQNNSPYWSLQGNSNASTSKKLGTTNSIPLNLYTNNKIRMHIETSGNVSIGNNSTSDPNYRLYVKGSSFGIRGFGTTTGVLGESTNGYGLRGTSTASFGIYATSTNSYGGYITSTNSDGLDVYTSGGYYGVYATSGNTAGYGVYGYGAYTGVYASGGTYGSQAYGNSYGIYAVSSSGDGVYGNSSDGYGGYFSSTNSYGIRAATTNGFYAGVFDGAVYAFGGYYPASDRKLKKNIQDVSDAMSIINKLQPKYYEFKSDDAQYAAFHLPTGTHYGLIAQDLEQVLPNLVHTENLSVPVKVQPQMLKPKSADGKDDNQYQKAAVPTKTEVMDIKGVNYDELIPILIAAMKEQNAKIEALTQQVNALTASKQSSMSSAPAAIKLSGSYLGQSRPNPATGTASIQYSNLPAGAHAQLFISDANGKMIKQIALSSNSGNVNLDVSSLSTGTYTYSLLIDGKLMDSKSLQIVR